MAKVGSTVVGLTDAFATVVSLALRHGMALNVLFGKFGGCFARLKFRIAGLPQDKAELIG